MGEEFSEIEDSDVLDSVDVSSEIDDVLDGMTLDELRDLRDALTEDQQDISDDYEEIEKLEDLGTQNEEDYSYHWDGEPTHNVEWDDNDENPAVLEKTLRRR